MNRQNGIRKNNSRKQMNDRQYEQVILSFPKQKLTLFGSFTLTAKTTNLDPTETGAQINITFEELTKRTQGYSQIFSIHNAVKPLGFTLHVSPISTGSFLPNQLGLVSFVRFNGKSATQSRSGSNKIATPHGTKIVYVYPKINRIWTDNVANIQGGVRIDAVGVKAEAVLAIVYFHLTFVMD